ncbi:MAG: hypothetical protein RL518_1689 [Pseudomonadota bacterium]|jgi:hypothetical protein
MAGASSDDRGTTNHGKGPQDTEADLSSSKGSDALISARKGVLQKEDFSEEEIAKIAQKAADLNVKILKPMAGDSIDHTAGDAVQLMQEHNCPVVFKFNSQTMVVSHKDTMEGVVAAYHAELDEAYKRYWTPERVAEKEAKDAAFKAEMNQAFETLPEFFKKWVVDARSSIYGRDLDILISKDAHLLATTLKSVEAIENWYQLDHGAQMSAVQGLSNHHSGGSFSLMVNLAARFLKAEAGQG